MNKFCQKLIAIVTMFFCSSFGPVCAGWQPYEWLVTIQTEELPYQLNYAGSQLTPVVEVQISYARADGSQDTKYETLWFCRGKALGLEREQLLDVGPGQSVAIRVIHKTKIPKSYDFKAAANSILRLFLDVRASCNMLQTVIVPKDSFSPITDELSNEHFSVFYAPLDIPYQIACPLFIQDEDDKQTQTMCYAPNSAGY